MKLLTGKKNIDLAIYFTSWIAVLPVAAASVAIELLVKFLVVLNPWEAICWIYNNVHYPCLKMHRDYEARKMGMIEKLPGKLEPYRQPWCQGCQEYHSLDKVLQEHVTAMNSAIKERNDVYRELLPESERATLYSNVGYVEIPLVCYEENCDNTKHLIFIQGKGVLCMEHLEKFRGAHALEHLSSLTS